MPRVEIVNTERGGLTRCVSMCRYFGIVPPGLKLTIKSEMMPPDLNSVEHEQYLQYSLKSVNNSLPPCGGKWKDSDLATRIVIFLKGTPRRVDEYLVRISKISLELYQLFNKNAFFCSWSEECGGVDYRRTVKIQIFHEWMKHRCASIRNITWPILTYYLSD